LSTEINDITEMCTQTDDIIKTGVPRSQQLLLHKSPHLKRTHKPMTSSQLVFSVLIGTLWSSIPSLYAYCIVRYHAITQSSNQAAAT